MPVAVDLGDRLELAQQLPLTVGEIDRRFDDDVTEQVTVLAAAHAANALAAQPEHLARLSFGGNSDLCRAVERGYLDFPAERCRCEAHRHLAMQIEIGRAHV